MTTPDENGITPNFRMPPRRYQRENFDKFKVLHAGALFSLPGTGKTKVVIDIMCYRFVGQALTGVLVLSSPKGVHSQWVTRHLPAHVWDNVPYQAIAWDGKRPAWPPAPGAALQIFSANLDAINSDRAFGVMMTFCAAHRGKLMIVIDESDKIKNYTAKRSKRVRALAAQYDCQQRLIMSGTPIARDLTDEWSQFYFLDPAIIGHKHKHTFMAEYCIMGGFEMRQVVDHRNVEQFKALTAPYIFRADKSELDLPAKNYDEIEFDLTAEQQRLLRELKTTMLARLSADPRDMIIARHGATALLRAQQIVNGFAVPLDGDPTAPQPLAANPRLDALKNLLEQLDRAPVIIWCRFHYDIAAVCNALPGRYARIYGGVTSEREREQEMAKFIDGTAQYLVASPDTAGRGFDGLQDRCSTAVFYSNSFNAVARWQAEDRIHRIGQRQPAMYYDLIARGSPDRLVLRNLRDKKTLSANVLDDVRTFIEEILP